MQNYPQKVQQKVALSFFQGVQGSPHFHCRSNWIKKWIHHAFSSTIAGFYGLAPPFCFEIKRHSFKKKIKGHFNPFSTREFYDYYLKFHQHRLWTTKPNMAVSNLWRSWLMNYKNLTLKMYPKPPCTSEVVRRPFWRIIF